MGRYTLKSEVNGLKPTIIEVPENKKLKQKVSLMSIDSLTLGSTPFVVLKKLDFGNAKVISQGKFYISYISQKQEKQLNVLFNDAHGLKSIAEEGNREINPNNKAFHEFIDKVFLPLTNDLEFMRFARNNEFLTPKLNEWIGNLYSRRYGKDFCIQKIKEYAASYKKFRALVMAVELYRNPKYLEPNQNMYFDDDRDPDLDGFYSKEELKEQEKYLENLPDSFDVHRKRY